MSFITDNIDDDILLNFLYDLVSKIENKNMSHEEKQIICDTYIKYNMNNNTENETMKFYTLGWYFYTILNKE
jgi:hypothetical protein